MFLKPVGGCLCKVLRSVQWLPKGSGFPAKCCAASVQGPGAASNKFANLHSVERGALSSHRTQVSSQRTETEGSAGLASHPWGFASHRLWPPVRSPTCSPILGSDAAAQPGLQGAARDPLASASTTTSLAIAPAPRPPYCSDHDPCTPFSPRAPCSLCEASPGCPPFSLAHMQRNGIIYMTL